MSKSAPSLRASRDATPWNYELIDLTRPLTRATGDALMGDLIAGAPHLAGVKYERLIGWNTANGAVGYLGMPDHIGTHMDAPVHC